MRKQGYKQGYFHGMKEIMGLKADIRRRQLRTKQKHTQTPLK